MMAAHDGYLLVCGDSRDFFLRSSMKLGRAVHLFLFDAIDGLTAAPRAWCAQGLLVCWSAGVAPFLFDAIDGLMTASLFFDF